jgi:NAD(P)-dependent dehydrogenase (short-subunit alcohol dehydrogenase family)
MRRRCTRALTRALDVREERLRETAALADARELHLLTAPADISSAEQTTALADIASQRLGGLDGLINNAAVVEAWRPVRLTRSTKTSGIVDPPASRTTWRRRERSRS